MNSAHFVFFYNGLKNIGTVKRITVIKNVKY